MIKIVLVLLFLVSFNTSRAAGLPGLANTYVNQLSQTKALITQSKLNLAAYPQKCEAQVVNVAKDNKLDIAVVYGYMDVSNLGEYVDSGMNKLPYDYGDVLDLDSRAALVSKLVTQCPTGKQKQKSMFFACGFEAKKNGKFTKTATNRFTGQPMAVTITVVNPSLSTEVNYSDKQMKNSAAVTSYFHSALQSQDAVIYMGHARSGGGPDFDPPIYSSGFRVNYPLYKSTREGLLGMIGALSATHYQPPFIGVLACKSTGLFKASIQNAAPNSVIVTAGELFDYNDVVPTGYAMLEALVGQKCSEHFKGLVKIQPKSSSFVNVAF